MPWKTVGVALVGLAVLAGCGSSSSSSKATTPATAAATTAAATTTTLDPVAAKAEIKANWTKFFDASITDINAKLGIMENAAKIGDTYKAVMTKSGAGSSTNVSDVTLLSASECNDALGESLPCAKVTYDLLVNGKTALAAQIGYAVLDQGVWKISQVTNCALLALGGSTCPA